MYCLPLSKSSWIEGRFGPEEYQDYYRILKISIDFLNKNKINKIILLSDFKSKQAQKSELENMIDICNKYNFNKEKLYINNFGYDTLSQIKFTIDLCIKENQGLLIISSFTHYPRVRWIAWRINKGRIKIKHNIGLGIPRFRDVLSDTILVFIYPIFDLLGYSERFTKHIKIRRDKGYLL
jgi:hypothetical protein